MTAIPAPPRTHGRGAAAAHVSDPRDDAPPAGISEPAGVTAHARVTAAPDGRGGTALPTLVSDGPLALRRSRGGVTVVGAMAAPLGGDRLRIDVGVRAGARLRIGSAAATLSLPGRGGAEARYDVALDVDEGASLHWLPEPVIAAAGSRLRTTTRVGLAPGARLVLREELVLGRAGEAPGDLVARLAVRYAGRPILDQELSFGPRAPGWSGAAVLGRHRACGQLLVVHPGIEERVDSVTLLGDADAGAHAGANPVDGIGPGRQGTRGGGAAGAGEAFCAPLAHGPAVLVTAVAPDALALRRLLDTALRSLTAPLSP